MNKKKKVVLKKHRKNKARIRSLMQNMVSKKKTGLIEGKFSFFLQLSKGVVINFILIVIENAAEWDMGREESVRINQIFKNG